MWWCSMPQPNLLCTSHSWKQGTNTSLPCGDNDQRALFWATTCTEWIWLWRAASSHTTPGFPIGAQCGATKVIHDLVASDPWVRLLIESLKTFNFKIAQFNNPTTSPKLVSVLLLLCVSFPSAYQFGLFNFCDFQSNAQVWWLLKSLTCIAPLLVSKFSWFSELAMTSNGET